MPGEMVSHNGCLWLNTHHYPRTCYFMDEPGVGWTQGPWTCIDPRPLSPSRIPRVVDRRFRKKWMDELLRWKHQDTERWSARCASHSGAAVPLPPNWREKNTMMERRAVMMGVCTLTELKAMLQKRRNRQRRQLIAVLETKKPAPDDPHD